jgi:hypothetical protein
MGVELVAVDQAEQFVNLEMIDPLRLVHINGSNRTISHRIAKAKDLGRGVL